MQRKMCLGGIAALALSTMTAASGIVELAQAYSMADRTRELMLSRDRYDYTKVIVQSREVDAVVSYAARRRTYMGIGLLGASVIGYAAAYELLRNKPNQQRHRRQEDTRARKSDWYGEPHGAEPDDELYDVRT